MATIKIYKLTSAQTNKVYIGSTESSLSTRLSRHKADYRRYMNGLRTNITSFEIVKYDDCKIDLVCECLPEDRLLREEQIQNETDECVNRYRPTIHTMGERKERDTPDNFTEDQIERINNAPTYNAKCVLKNYYRKKDTKLKLSALRKIRKSGVLPKDTTIEKYNISATEIASALREYQAN